MKCMSATATTREKAFQLRRTVLRFIEEQGPDDQDTLICVGALEALNFCLGLDRSPIHLSRFEHGIANGRTEPNSPSGPAAPPDGGGGTAAANKE